MVASGDRDCQFFQDVNFQRAMSGLDIRKRGWWPRRPPDQMILVTPGTRGFTNRYISKDPYEEGDVKH